MEQYDVIDITVNLGSSSIDSILLQRQRPELAEDDTISRDSSSSAKDVWVVHFQDGPTYDVTESRESTCPGEHCDEDRNKTDVSRTESLMVEEASDPRSIIQINNDLPPDWNHEQKTEKIKQDRTTMARDHFIEFRTNMDPILASCFMCVMRHSEVYRLLFLKNLCEQCSSSLRKTKLHRGSCGVRLILDLRQSSLFSMEPDIRWSKKMLPLWLARVSMEDSFSWLSTLGGAYSALGDHFQDFAEKAGKVSIHQMKLACQIGDPILLARCRVYMAQSLMQKGFIPQAMFIVRAQYRFAMSLGDCTDQRLINMCKGVWSIIQYLHRRNKGRRKNGVGLHPPSSETR